MAIIYDAHRHIQTGTNADVERYDDGRALSERIYEWLETPEGTVADLPHWGHNLIGYKHDPQGPSLAAQLELSIARKLRQDIKNLKLLGIGVEYLDIDFFKITIRHQLGNTTSELRL